MKISDHVTIGDQVGEITAEDDTTINVALTNLRGRIPLAVLESLTSKARDLNRRINPPATKKPVKKRRR